MRLKQRIIEAVLQSARETFTTPFRVRQASTEVTAARCTLLGLLSIRELLEHVRHPWTGREALQFAATYLHMSLRATEWSSVRLAAEQMGMPPEVVRALVEGTRVPDAKPAEPPQPVATALETAPEPAPRPECHSCSEHGQPAPEGKGRELWIKNPNGSCPHYPDAAQSSQVPLAATGEQVGGSDASGFGAGPSSLRRSE